jgi:hypothetical protein
MNYKIEKTFTQNIYEERLKSRYFQIIDLINPENLNINNEEELYHVTKIIMAVTFQNLVHAFAKEIPIGPAVKTYSVEVELLKRGFYKRRNEYDAR